MNVFGDRLRNLIDLNFNSITSAADSIGISGSILSDIINGKKKQGVSAKTLLLLCKFFDVSSDYLLGLSDELKPPVIQIDTHSFVKKGERDLRLIDADILRNKLLEAKDDEEFVLSPHLMLLWLDLMPSVGDDSTGVWLKTTADNHEVRKFSACHKTILGRMQKAYSYCPHCGFRMVGDIDY